MAADYSKLIDAETWAFIERTNSYYPPDTVDYTVQEQRAIYDRMCREFHSGYPAGVTAGTGPVEDPAGDVQCRVYRRDNPDNAAAVMYLHGGGFILGGLESHDDVCAEICAQTGFDVISVDYRLAPEHKHPAAFNDAMTVFRFLQTRPKPIVLCGDSAGGNLAAAVAHATRGQPNPPIGQVLIYPGLGWNQSEGSYVTHADAPMLTKRDLDFYRAVRTSGGDLSKDYTFAPLRDPDMSGLPPTAIITAECDPLSSDGETYRDRIQEAGGRAWWQEEAGLVHGYLRARHSVAKARDSFTRIVNAVSFLGHQEWPY